MTSDPTTGALFTDAFGVRTAVITGASAGVGRATAIEFARRGWTIGLVARGEEGLAAAKSDVEAAGGRALVLPCDVGDADAVQAAAERAASEFGYISAFVTSARTSSGVSRR